MSKVILILVDGMRPDAFLSAGNPYAEELLRESTHCLSCQTVVPSVTLPCHMSLFHSVDPSRHGILSNTYTPQVRPIDGLVERLDQFEKRCAFFITWEQLRDLSRPGHLVASECINISPKKNGNVDRRITEKCIDYVRTDAPDFVFLYLGETDEIGGHRFGWMTPEYLQNVSTALDCVKQVKEVGGEAYDVILMADHGGHDRTHGTEMAEDMTIPLLLLGKPFAPGELAGEASIKDIAPTVTALFGIEPDEEWEGKSLL
jgi:predicted AlkP superfamily pyrophosphatase or phosphodiesterase